MKTSLRWLRRYVDITESPETLAHDLTMFGLNVEGVEKAGPEFEGVVYGTVLSCERHPNADRLSVCTVDAGKAEPLGIVCGAPNVRAGLSVAVAVRGAVLPGGFRIKKTKLRGVVSDGMICSAKELGIGADAAGIMELDFEETPGTDLAGLLGDEDHILDIEVTPNRPDQLSHIGIAREIAAMYRCELRIPEQFTLRTDARFPVTVGDPGDCPRFSAAVIDDVHIEPSPEWLQKDLVSAGVKPINNIVDVTNYVLLELGQPLHAYDRDRLPADELGTRLSHAGEELVTLDGVLRELGDGILVITSGDRPVGLAGVMGGEATEVRDETTRIVLESAMFNPRRIRESSRRMKLDTEASYRFERGGDPGGTVTALERACGLIGEIGAGTPVAACTDRIADPRAIERRIVPLRVRHANRVMGTTLSAEDLEGLLSRLELPSTVEGETLRVAVPTFRRDIVQEIDLVEEAARAYGYDNIGREEIPRANVFAFPAPADIHRNEIRRWISSRGFAQVMTTAFMDPADVDCFDWEERDPRRRFVQLANPLTGAQSVMRTSLLPGMLHVIKRNVPAESEGIRIFETGKVFIPEGDGTGLPREEMRLTAVMARKANPVSWLETRRDVDFFDMKGELESILERLGATWEPERLPGTGYRFSCVSRGERIAEFGQVPAAALARWDLDGPIFFFDVALDDLAPAMTERFEGVVPYPAVKRDLCLVAGERVTFGDIRNVLKKRLKHLESINLFDYYRGERVEEGQRSYTFRVTFRSPQGTLEDAAVDREIEKALTTLGRELGVTLRSDENGGT